MNEPGCLRSRYAIFLPVRNGSLYLREAIDSVIAQTRHDWLLLVLDNCSDDGSADIVASYQHPAIRLFRSEQSLSIWHNWHRVWRMLSEGAVGADFVTIIGHDDRLRPNFFETIDCLIVKYPRASLYQTAFDMIDSDGRLIRPCKPIPVTETGADFLAARMWGLRDSFGTGYVFRAADYISVGGIPELPHLFYSDDLLFARLSQIGFKASSREIQCEYRLHSSSTSGSMNGVRIAAQVSALEKFIKSLIQEFPEVSTGATGDAALACLLARDVLMLRPFVDTPLLPSKTSEAVGRLSKLYNDVARGIDYRQWLGTNFISRTVYGRAKQAMLLTILLRDRSKVRSP